jgi:hypothetical protein
MCFAVPLQLDLAEILRQLISHRDYSSSERLQCCTLLPTNEQKGKKSRNREARAGAQIEPHAGSVGGNQTRPARVLVTWTRRGIRVAERRQNVRDKRRLAEPDVVPRVGRRCGLY